MTSQMIYDVGDRPKFKNLFLYAAQLLLAILAGTIGVPIAIGLPAQIPAAILGAGIGTLVYILFTKGKSPMTLSSNFAFVAAFPTAIAFGYMGIWLGGIFSGVVYLIIALVIHFVGTDWINKLMPAVIIGPVVALIGLGLAPTAMKNLVTANASAKYGLYNLVSLFCGLVTFFIVVFFTVQNKHKGLKLIPFILGIAAGYALASIFTAIGNATNNDYLKIINWSELQKFEWADFFSLPKISLAEGIKELMSGEPSKSIVIAHALNLSKNDATAYLFTQFIKDGKTFTETYFNEIKSILEGANMMPQAISWVGVASITLAFCPIALVGFAEHIADHKNMSRIIDRDLLKDPGMTRTVLGDGVGSIAGSTLGVCPNTSYGESIACVAMTRNASVWTTGLAAIMCILLSFITPFNKALATIPSCVMGGICLALYGYISVSGLKMFKDIDLDDNVNLLTVCSILIIGIGGLLIKIPYQIDEKGQVAKAIEITSIATALIVGILTYQFAKKVSGKQKTKVNEINTRVKQEDNFRAYLKQFNADALANAVMTFGFLFENIDYAAATLSNLMRSKEQLNIRTHDDLVTLIKLFEFKGYKKNYSKEKCIDVILDNIVRIDKTVLKNPILK